MASRADLINRALSYIYNDKMIPVDLYIEMSNAGIDPEGLIARHTHDRLKIGLSHEVPCDLVNNVITLPSE